MVLCIFSIDIRKVGIFKVEKVRENESEVEISITDGGQFSFPKKEIDDINDFYLELPGYIITTNPEKLAIKYSRPIWKGRKEYSKI